MLHRSVWVTILFAIAGLACESASDTGANGAAAGNAGSGGFGGSGPAGVGASGSGGLGEAGAGNGAGGAAAGVGGTELDAGSIDDAGVQTQGKCEAAACGTAPCLNGICTTTWLEYANVLRGLSNSPTVTEDATMSAAAANHARYIVENDELAHSEDSTNAFYTPEGHGAAMRGLPWGASMQLGYEDAFLAWQQAPFHILAILNPSYLQFGYAEYFDAASASMTWGVTLVVDNEQGPASGGLYETPLVFPGEGAESPIALYWGETPSPLSACPGYVEPAGLPLVASFGLFAGDQEILSTELLDLDTLTAVEHCAFDDQSYTFPDQAWLDVAKAILDGYEAIVIIPRSPLTPGGQYRATVRSMLGEATWTFSVSPTAPQTL